MKQNKLLEAVGMIDDQLIIEYDTFQKKKSRHNWRIAIVTAASFCLLLAGGLFGVLQLGLLNFGGSSGGGGSNQDTQNYMYYTGPVFPLTLSAENESISARRSITFDFSPYATRTKYYEITEDGKTVRKEYTAYDRESLVTDSYFLKNNNYEEETVTIVYPFASSLNELTENRPILSLNGEELATELVFGPYSGGFTGTWSFRSGGNEKEEELYNLKQIDNWLDYKVLLSDGRYMDLAFQEPPQLQQQVIVYEFTDFVIEDGEGTNPSLGVHYNADNRTTVLSYGFHGLSNDGKGNFIQGFSLPDVNIRQGKSHFWLIVIGDEIQNLQMQGYKNMSLSKGNEMNISANINRREADLDETLRYLLADFLSLFTEGQIQDDDEAFARHYQASVELLLSYGVLSDNAIERYDLGWLPDVFSEAGNIDRVMYLTADVSIPAGNSIEIKSVLTKKGNHDFYCRNKRDANIEGYEMVTRLGSNIYFNEQQANIEDHGLIEIVRQNFGFDLVQGIRSVILDFSEEHYFLEIRKIVPEN